MSHPAVDRLARALDGFILAADRADPAAPSRCAGWTNADVVEHVIGVTDRFAARALGSAESSPDIVTAAERSAAAWATTELGAEWQLGFGTFTAATCADINAFDALVHAWDIGGDVADDDDLVVAAIAVAERLVWQEDHYGRPPAVDARTAFERLLVLTGRDPRSPGRPSPERAPPRAGYRRAP